jgi:hypothetical protein
VEEGLETTEDEESLRSVLVVSPDCIAHSIRTMYMNTAPKTAPATAPPSLGSSSEPMTKLLLPCETVSPNLLRAYYMLLGVESDRRGARTLKSEPITERITIANMDMTMLSLH